MWEQRSKFIFLSSQFTFFVILLQMGMYLTQFWMGKEPVFNIFQLCSNWIQVFGFTWIDYLLDVLVVSTFIHCLLIVMKQLYLSRQTYKKFLLLQNAELTAVMNINRNKDILVVTHQNVIAITMGFMFPKVIVSTGLLQMLDKDEVEAVILHERFHQKNKDPLKILLMHICSSVLWYIPILKWSYKHYKVTRELMADSYSIHVTGSSEGIGTALLKLLRNKQAKSFSFSYASFADNAINLRINQIMDPQSYIAFRLPTKRMVISILILFTLSAMLITELL